jgi:hypothetical protein
MPKKIVKTEILVQEHTVSVMRVGNDDYISLTDIAKYDNQEHPADVVKNWLRNKDTIEFLGLWEKINNNNFKLVEFDQFVSQSGRSEASPTTSRSGLRLVQTLF